MGEFEKYEGSKIISLIHGKGGSISLSNPFEREIFLFDTHVAGTNYIEGIQELGLYLKADEKLDFFREPDNPYDSMAIVIKNTNGVKIGYVPKADNVIFSRLMDAGKLLFGRITNKEMAGNWLKIGIKVFLQE